MKASLRQCQFSSLHVILICIAAQVLAACGDGKKHCEAVQANASGCSAGSPLPRAGGAAFQPIVKWIMGSNNIVVLGDYALWAPQEGSAVRWTPVRELSESGMWEETLADGFYFADYNALVPQNCGVKNELQQWNLLLSRFSPREQKLFASADNFVQAASKNTIQVNQCELKNALSCVLKAKDEVAATLGPLGVTADSSQDEAQRIFALNLLQKAVNCNNLRKESIPRKEYSSFYISSSHILFTPEQLVSISIYAGDKVNYGEALRNATPLAVVPVPENCSRFDSRCLISPLSKSLCKGCEDLKENQQYTAFLLEQKVQQQSSVRRFVFQIENGQ